MTELDDKHFHKLYGLKKPRMTYRKADFLDYTIMTMLCALVIFVAYGPTGALLLLGLALCGLLYFMFTLRHGVAFVMPLLLRRPQDVLYMLIYKIRNLQPMYPAAVAVFALDQLVIWATPQWPHNTELMHTIALFGFYAHFVGISIFRTAILVSHMLRRDTVRDALMESGFKLMISRRPSISLHVFHAYFTGLLAHLMLIAPWYIIITYFQFSVLTTPVMLLINFVIHMRVLKGFNDWFYRDHWLGHNSELEFVYLHGTHHDAIPCGLIGVAGNGHLEGFARHTLGYPMAFYNPVLAAALYTYDVVEDIKNHQFIPGVFPELPRRFHEVTQHSTHHWGGLEPYGIAVRLDPSDPLIKKVKGFEFPPQELANSIKLDEQLTGFKWDNPVRKKFLRVYDKYQK
jgi:hypothetical protein